MDYIESKIKVDKTTDVYKWVAGLDIQLGTVNYQHTLRDDDINAILYITCFYLLNECNINPGQIPASTLITYACQYIPTIATYMCQYFLHKNNVEITPEIYQTIISRLSAETLSEKFWSYIGNRISGSTDKYLLHSSILNLSFQMDVKPDFIEKIVGDFIPVETNLQEIEEFKAGMIVCSVTLIELISKNEYSEVWKASHGKRMVAVKIEPLNVHGKELNKLLVGKDSKKIISYIKEEDDEYKNYKGRLQVFPYKVENFAIDYYSPLNMKVKLMTFLDGPVGKVNIGDKRDFFKSMVNVLFSLHSQGLCFGNLSINHIMIRSDLKTNQFRLIDYKNVKNIGEISTLDHGKYRSLRLLRPEGDSTRLTPYHDIESLLYIFNDIILGKESEYESLNEEISRKSTLSTFSGIVAEAIISLRKLMDSDSDIFFNDIDGAPNSSETITNHVKNIYINGFLNTNIGENVPGLVNIVTVLSQKFTEIPHLSIDMTYANQILLNKVRVLFAQDQRFQHIINDPKKYDDITVKIVNVMTTSSIYSDEDMYIINEYLKA